MAEKMRMWPMPKTMPESAGMIQWFSCFDVQPNHSNAVTYSGPPRQAGGRRPYSSTVDHFAPLALAPWRMRSHQSRIPRPITAPAATAARQFADRDAVWDCELTHEIT